MKKDGFIATSLVYSFFLVFVAIVAALLNNYIANKTILLRYNEEALDALNTQKYEVSFVLYGAEANTASQKSRAFTNLVQNGNFLDDSSWNKVGTGDFVTTSFSKNTARLSNFSASSYIYQDVRLVKNQKYYFSVDYAQAQTAPIQTYVEPLISLVSQNTGGTWLRSGGEFYAESSTDAQPFVIGYSTIGYENAYFTNAMLINLTEHFGVGNEPSTKWMNENIEFFTGTMNYLKEENLMGGSELELTMISQKGLNTATPVCTSSGDEWLQTTDNLTVTYDFSGERPVARLKLKNITDDISCIVRWTE